MEKLVLIDGNSIINRAFYGLPDLTTTDGKHTNGILGFVNILLKILEEEKPQYLTVAFDVHHPTFRHEMYAEYKGTRKGMPEELREQVPRLKELLSAMGILMLERPGYEADDILGTLAKRAEQDGYAVSLVSGDRDLLQIADDVIKVRIPKTKQSGTEIEDYHTADVIEKYGITPPQIIDLKGLMGDPSDNIPGVPGIGEKGAVKLLQRFGTVEETIEHLEEITPNRTKEALRANVELARLSKSLATIKTDCELDFTYEKAKLGDIFTPEAYQLLKQLEMKSLLPRFALSETQMASESKVSEEYTLITDLGGAEEAFARLASAAMKTADGMARTATGGTKGAVSTEKETAATKGRADTELAAAVADSVEFLGLAPLYGRDGALLALMVVLGKEHLLFLVEGFLTEEFLWERVNGLFCGKGKSAGTQKPKTDAAVSGQDAGEGESGQTGVRLAAFDVKSFAGALSEEARAASFDLMIAAYLLNPLKDSYLPVDIARDYLDSTVPSVEDVLGKKALSAALADGDEAAYRLLARSAAIAAAGAPELKKRLAEEEMLPLFEEVEMPLTFALYDMEQAGILVDRAALAEYGKNLQDGIHALETEIYQMAGEEFNINSPKQLGVILFEKLKMPYGKKTKTGYSTSADVLERLKTEDPVIEKILEYRQLTKLKSTYADGLDAFIGADGRIHSKFNQTITATGRLSSTEPNLQNIPVRLELGRQIRRLFFPQEGCIFVDADYSQIELRILAHMSGDESLIQAYREQQDIHRMTASKVFHIPFDEVTPAQRSSAKAVNFGIVYGISSFGLGENLNITRKEAEAYIEQYFKTYPGIKEYLDGLVKMAKEKGYVTTLYHRRRPVPEISSSNFMQRNFGERVAMNSPIQGTAADIMKIAMLKVARELKERRLKSRILLQIHDELLVEAPLSEAEEVVGLLKEQMMAAADLSVPLEVEVNTGANWYETK